MAEGRTRGVGAALLTVHSELSNEECKHILGHSRKLSSPASSECLITTWCSQKFSIFRLKSCYQRTLDLGVRNSHRDILHTCYNIARLEVFLTALMKIQLFVDITSCQPVNSDVEKEYISFETQVSTNRQSINSQKLNLRELLLLNQKPWN